LEIFLEMGDSNIKYILHNKNFYKKSCLILFMDKKLIEHLRQKGILKPLYEDYYHNKKMYVERVSR